MIFRIFFENADLQNSCAHAVFRKGRALKNQPKIETKRIKNQCKVGLGKTVLQNCSKDGFGGVLGFIWEGFGGVLGLLLAALGSSLDALGAFLGRFWGALARSWGQDELQEAFWMDFGLLCEGFGTDLGRFGDQFEKIWSWMLGFAGLC